MKKLIIIALILISGCTAHTVEPEPIRSYHVEQRMSPAMKAVVMEMIWLKSDPNVFKVKEKDPFRRQ